MTKLTSRSSLPESSVSTGTLDDDHVFKIKISVLVTTGIVVVVDAAVVVKLVVVVELGVGRSFDYSTSKFINYPDPGEI